MLRSGRNADNHCVVYSAVVRSVAAELGGSQAQSFCELRTGCAEKYVIVNPGEVMSIDKAKRSEPYEILPASPLEASQSQVRPPSPPISPLTVQAIPRSRPFHIMVSPANRLRCEHVLTCVSSGDPIGWTVHLHAHPRLAYDQHRQVEDHFPPH
jgi:hypothetical protein